MWTVQRGYKSEQGKLVRLVVLAMLASTSRGQANTCLLYFRSNSKPQVSLALQNKVYVVAVRWPWRQYQHHVAVYIDLTCGPQETQRARELVL